MTTAAPSTALVTIQPVFTGAERLALAGFLAAADPDKRLTPAGSRYCRLSGTAKPG